MAACPSESLGRQFLVDVATVDAGCLEESRLHVDRTGDRMMIFTAASP
jgi:hypothetical protein